MIAPVWTQVKVGPLLRGEKDLRFYTGLFRPAPDEIAGMRKWWTLLRYPRAAEPVRGVQDNVLPDNCIIQFSGMHGYFEPLNGHSRLLRQEFEATLSPAWRTAASRRDLPPIGVHVRRGDFHVPQSAEELASRGGVQTPVEWFVEALRCVRDVAGAPLPAFVVSDGAPGQLAALLGEPDVTFIDSGSAAGDLLTLSNARLIIGSGGSSFSAWASYLGESPVVTMPGHDLSWFGLRHSHGAYVGCLAPRNPTELLAANITAIADRYCRTSRS